MGVVASILIGAVFVFSGGSKLVDREIWLRQSSDLGVVPWLARLVPWYELVVGALLLSGVARPWPAVVAVATLVVFTVFILRRLRDGDRPPCACFGARSSRPLGRGQVARNAGLIVVALLATLAT
ncbi:MauE/DoxX family redox-associated membrane protein [Ilumatobacter nonamiensis]|uniref:MauE/DoxX family redox-associated membrane protein n=1 Tax=Ilumatobacter nonamiensis TaxID=467093 RepID=UPI00130E4FA9|nr:MauE/DoxX family redox-associated membrane protein [Ilumatobacter nonamiensis]